MTAPKQRLGDVALINPRPSRVPQPDEMVSFAGMADLSAEKGCITQSHLRPFAEVSKGYTSFCAKDILVAKITPCFENCKIGEASIPTDIGYGSTEFHVIRPLAARLDKRYLLHFLRQKRVLKSGERRMTGSAGQRRVPVAFLEALEIPLPSLEEQRRIAAILDKASRIAELCGTALKLSHAADKSLFLHFFADLPEKSDLLLEELADKRSNAIRTGPFGSQLLHGEFTDSGVAVLGIDNAVNNSFEWSKRRFISHEKYEQLKRYTVYPGDLLITIMGTCGRAAVVPDDIPQAINTKHLCAISVDGSVVLPEYLHSYILFHPSASRYLSKRTKGAIMEGLNMTIIKELPVTVPPMSHQIAWLARRKILRSVAKRAQTMSASTLSLCQSFSYKLLEERGA